MPDRRRRHRSLTRALATAVTLGVLATGCTDEGDRPHVPVPGNEVSPQAIPTELTCPGGEMVGMTADFPAGTEGDETRQQAVVGWLASRQWSGDPYVLSTDGESAWVLREDGTARARIRLLEGDGFLTGGYDECTGTGVDVTPVYPVGRENPWRPRAVVVTDGAGVGGGQTLSYRGVLVTIPDDWVRVGPGCGFDTETWVPPGQKYCVTERGIRFHPSGTFQPVQGFGAHRTPGADPEWSGFAEAGDVEVHVGAGARTVVEQVLSSLRVQPE